MWLNIHLLWCGCRGVWQIWAVRVRQPSPSLLWTHWSLLHMHWSTGTFHHTFFPDIPQIYRSLVAFLNFSYDFNSVIICSLKDSKREKRTWYSLSVAKWSDHYSGQPQSFEGGRFVSIVQLKPTSSKKTETSLSALVRASRIHCVRCARKSC